MCRSVSVGNRWGRAFVRAFGACFDASEAMSAHTWRLDPAGRTPGVSFVQ
jgi:hypothetical protein